MVFKKISQSNDWSGDDKDVQVSLQGDEWTLDSRVPIKNESLVF